MAFLFSHGGDPLFALVLRNRINGVLAATPQQLWRTPATRPRLWQLRSSAGRPYRRLWLDAGYIAQAKGRDVRAQISISVIAGIHQHHAARQASWEQTTSDRSLRRALPARRYSCVYLVEEP